MKILSQLLTLFLVVVVATSQPLSSVDIISRDSELELKNLKKCPEFRGNFTIDQYQLYPENADFSFHTCLLYISAVWNASLAIYDPYSSKIVEVIEFPRLSHRGTYHLSGINVDKRTGFISLVINYFNTILSGGKDLSGDTFILQWDPVSHKLVYKINLAHTTRRKYGGFEDVEQDPEGNVYVLGSYPSSILKVSKDGKKVVPWYLHDPMIPTVYGFSGLATTGWTLLVSDTDNKLLRFDLRAEKGEPVIVPWYPNVTWTETDAIYLPPRYSGKVLLVAEDSVGITVLRSKDGLWHTAEHLGHIPNTVPNTWTTASVQIGESVYLIVMDIGDVNNPNAGAGNQSHFPFVDITQEIDSLIGL
ncbi:hypothetical protein HYFRA_00003654 [Hymenoscyphus fraxineus]|uniref:Uncharacterized protein n=1 Tax=Hymenoscyphus fraxineus TaxID=746836 RepID=A0A9N9KZE1_9HELO|nr:hypothetical protein HYFRA_00003654 [Hymenoscyphus fraxineus]